MVSLYFVPFLFSSVNNLIDAMAMTNSRLLGALIKVLPADKAESLIKYVTLHKIIDSQV